MSVIHKDKIVQLKGGRSVVSLVEIVFKTSDFDIENSHVRTPWRHSATNQLRYSDNLFLSCDRSR